MLNAVPNEHLGRQALLIMVKQATALAILLALTSIFEMAEVVVALCHEEQTDVEEMMIIKNDFCTQMVSLHSRKP